MNHPVSNTSLQLRKGRIVSIDYFRALTILLMVAVNEWHSVIGLPEWMKHMPADADGMSFADVIFPAFLFIVGMSIPFALQQRSTGLQARGQHWWQVQSHILMRALGLIVIGVFMVNAEGGFHAASMSMPIPVWALLSFLAAFLIWGSLKGGAALSLQWRISGVILLAVLAAMYRGGATGDGLMTAQWWGILGLIGWAYLIATTVYQFSKGNIRVLLIGITLCITYFLAHKSFSANPFLNILFSQEGHFSHAALVLCGCVTAIIFFDESASNTQSQTPSQTQTQRFAKAFLFAAGLAVFATILRPEFKISKIYATPSWVLYCAAICVLLYSVLYRLIDVPQPAPVSQAALNTGKFSGLLAAVAANPLIAYLLPFVVYYCLQLLQWQAPLALRSDWGGIAYGAVFSILIALATRKIASKGIRLRI